MPHSIAAAAVLASSTSPAAHRQRLAFNCLYCKSRQVSFACPCHLFVLQINVKSALHVHVICSFCKSRQVSFVHPLPQANCHQRAMREADSDSGAVAALGVDSGSCSLLSGSTAARINAASPLPVLPPSPPYSDMHQPMGQQVAVGAEGGRVRWQQGGGATGPEGHLVRPGPFQVGSGRVCSRVSGHSLNNRSNTAWIAVIKFCRRL